MSPVLSRLLALALLVGAGFLLVFGLYLPIRTALGDSAEEVAALESQLARFRERLTEDRLRVTTRVADAALIEAPAPALAAAEIQRMIDRIAAGAGADVTGFRVEADIAEDGMTKIPVTLDLETDMPGLLQLLHRIEGATPYLFVRSLEIRRQRGSEAEEGRRILVSLGVYGLMARPATP